MEFFSNPIIKHITFFIVIIAFLSMPFLQGAVAKKLPSKLQADYKKLATDALIKTLLMFGGAAFFGALAFFKGDVDKAITQSMFGLCLFSAVGSTWVIVKTKTAIKEARDVSIAGHRQYNIYEIEQLNSKLATSQTIISFVSGLLGCTYMVLLYDTYPLEWMWFVAFISTGPAMLSAGFSDAANLIASKYASDPKLGV